MKHILIILLVVAAATLNMRAQQQGIQNNLAPKLDASARTTEQVMTTLGMPNKISYQGALTYVDSRGKTKYVKKGTYSIKFQLYDDKTAGALQDEHTYNVAVGKNGVYTVTLGEDGTDQGNLASNVFGKLLWLQVTALSGPETHITYPYVLSPRVQLTSVPYALGPWQQNASGLSYSNGNVGIGTTNPQYKLHVAGSQPTDESKFEGRVRVEGYFGSDLLFVKPGDDLNPNYGVIRYTRADASSSPFVVTKAGNVTASGDIRGSQIISTAPPGTPPLTVASSTLVPNLNAAQVNGATISMGNWNTTTSTFISLHGGSVEVKGTGLHDEKMRFVNNQAVFNEVRVSIISSAASSTTTVNGGATVDIAYPHYTPFMVIVSDAGGTSDWTTVMWCCENDAGGSYLAINQ